MDYYTNQKSIKSPHEVYFRSKIRYLLYHDACTTGYCIGIPRILTEDPTTNYVLSVIIFKNTSI